MYSYVKPVFHPKIAPCINNLALSPKSSKYHSNQMYNNPQAPQSPLLQRQQKQQRKNKMAGNTFNKQKSSTKNMIKEPNSQVLQFRATNEQKVHNSPKFLNNKTKDVKNEVHKQMIFKQVRYIKNIQEFQRAHSKYKSKVSQPITHLKKLERKDSDPYMNRKQIQKNESNLSCNVESKNNPQQYVSQRQRLMQIIQHQKCLIKQKNQTIERLERQLAKNKEQYSKRQTQIKSQLEKKYRTEIDEKTDEIKFINQKLMLQTQVFENLEKQLMKKQGQLNSLISDYSSLLINQSKLKSQVASLNTEVSQLNKINSLPNNNTQEGKIMLLTLQKQLDKITKSNSFQHQELINSKLELQGHKQTCLRLYKFIDLLNDAEIKRKLSCLNEKYQQKS